MNRRQYLSIFSTGAVLGLAGCAENTDNDEEQHAEIINHRIYNPERSTTLRFEASVENQSDEDLELVRVECSVFNDNERLADTSVSPGDLDAGIQASDDRSITDLADSVDDVTHYTLTLTYFLAGENTKYEFESEFEDFEVVSE